MRGTRLTLSERIRILTLANDAGWNKSRIARQLRLPYSTVVSCIESGFSTPRKQPGRKCLLTTRKRQRLIDRATKDAFHHWMPYEEVAQFEGIQAC
jgi:hypothetical protein